MPMTDTIILAGNPNVGKSTLFNKLIGERRSIVEDTPGVTRDRIYAEAEWNDHRFILIDTGNIGTVNGILALQNQVRAGFGGIHIGFCGVLTPRPVTLIDIQKQDGRCHGAGGSGGSQKAADGL